MEKLIEQIKKAVWKLEASAYAHDNQGLMTVREDLEELLCRLTELAAQTPEDRQVEQQIEQAKRAAKRARKPKIYE